MKQHKKPSLSRRHFLKSASLAVLGTSAVGHAKQFSLSPQSRSAEFGWPAITRECRPWAYWWWMGSAVDRANIARLLQSYSAAGMGGMHIIPIYGAKGYESRFIEFLSPKWMEALTYTVAEARAVGMGLDLTTGTGWPFGGPQVQTRHAAAMALFETYRLAAGERLDQPVRPKTQSDAPLAALMAFSSTGERLDLTPRVDTAGRLEWVAPEGSWELLALFVGRTKQQVKRAAPGGEGAVLDHFSVAPLKEYLARFDRAFARQRPGVRAMYNDSYEVYEADWTRNLLPEFTARRGYELKLYLRELAAKGADDLSARVLCDYRQTVSELLLENFTRPWVQWSHDKKYLTRNEAHGSPGDLLDLYAAVDIPETEAFGPSGFKIPGLRIDRNIPEHFGKPDPLFMKFASSAAHLTGKRFVSSESCTWLGEHFQIALSQVKPEIDNLFVGGVNHVFYHGINYSPADAPWPGWLFYASTNFGPSNTFWRDLPELNAYIARCQSVLQSGGPDSDVLLYFPASDLWQTPSRDGKLLRYLTAHNAEEWLHRHPSGFGEDAKELQRHGYGFDYISDRLLLNVRAEQDGLQSGGAHFRTIIVPACRLMPLRTLERLRDLAAGGATVIFKDRLPEDVEGLHELEKRRRAFGELKAGLGRARSRAGVDEYQIGKGRFLVGQQLDEMLNAVGARREALADHGLSLIRRTHPQGHHYFVTNLSGRHVEGWIGLSTNPQSVVILDPLLNLSGKAAVRRAKSGGMEVYLQVPPGQSYILRCFATRTVNGPQWKYLAPSGKPYEIEGKWEIRFLEGGPTLPATLTTEKLVSWPELGSAETRAFSGTAVYRIQFKRPVISSAEWVLEVGTVYESARVRLNGRAAGVLWSFPFQIAVGHLLREGENLLEIEVTNTPANRVADMARRQVKLTEYHNTKFVNIKYEPFDASGWEPLASGLLGPVRLMPQKALRLAASPA